MAFGKYFSEKLKAHGKTVSWISKKCGIPKTTLYSMIERDSTPDLGTVSILLTTLNEPLSAFFKSVSHDYILNPTSDYSDRPYFENLTHEQQSAVIKNVRDYINSKVEEATEQAQEIENEVALDIALNAYFMNVTAVDVKAVFSGLSSEDIDNLKTYADFLRSKKQSENN